VKGSSGGCRGGESLPIVVQRKDIMKHFKKYFPIIAYVFSMLVILLMFVLLVFIKTSHASQVTTSEQLVNCVIGEATGEGFEGMKAVALVYKHRLDKGMRLGCEAVTRPDIKEFVKREGKKQKDLAEQIIEKVWNNEYQDTTLGATHYIVSNMAQKPYWVKAMTITTVIGAHTFYKEK